MSDKPAQNISCFDLDELLALAQQDPAAFERHRAALIEAAICEAVAHGVNEARMRGLQFQLDGMRCVNQAPLQASLRLHGMMQERLRAMQKEFAKLLQGKQESEQEQDKKPGQTARIIHFKSE